LQHGETTTAETRPLGIIASSRLPEEVSRKRHDEARVGARVGLSRGSRPYQVGGSATGFA
jgi:hypothetical protein